jgi:O-antigen ligase
VFYDQFFFKSVGGVCEEPSLMAMNINVLFPMGYIYVKKYFPGVMLNIYSGLFVLAQIFMASSGGIGFFLLALIIYNMIYINPKVYANIISIIAVVGIIGSIIFIYLPDDLVRKSESFVEHVSSKIFFKNRSASMRTEAWNYGIEDWLSSPIVGKGPGFGNEGHNGFGYQSCYIKLMAEMGTPSTLLFILFLAVVVYRVLKLPREYRKMMFFSTVSCIMHFMIADGYYHIPFWIAVSFVQYFFIYQKTQKHLAEA